MFLLLRLILAHFVGDFVFQTDEIYKLRFKGFRYALFHYCIVFLTALAFAFPYLNHLGCWVVIVFASLTHVAQDEVKIRHSFSPKLNFTLFVLDQILHLAFFLPILFFKFAYIPLKGENIFVSLYNSDYLVMLLIWYFISVFMGGYFWLSLKISHLRATNHFSSYNVKFGMIERFLITTSMLGYPLFCLLALPVIFRIFSKKLDFSMDFVFNVIYATLVGLILRQILPFPFISSIRIS